MPFLTLRNKETKLIMIGVTVSLWKIYVAVEVTKPDERFS